MNTSSLTFPNLFDVTRNKLAVSEDRLSIINRVRLLILSNPTELYMNPRFGVGMHKYLFQYNSDNIIAIIRDNIVEQLKLWEPCVDAESTNVSRGLTYSSSGDNVSDNPNNLDLTVTVLSIYGDAINIDLPTIQIEEEH